MFRNIKDIEPKKVSTGVEERTLITPVETSYKILTIKVLTIEPNKETELKKPGEEKIYFVLDGKGTFTVEWLEAHWPYTIRGDMALWIPPTMEHRIKNCGDAPLRCLVGSCITDSKPDEREVSIHKVDMRQVHAESLIGWRFGVLFSPAMLKSIGATKFNLCAYNSLSPGGFLSNHAPTGRCEESMYVTRGYGTMTIGEEERTVEPGSIAYVTKDTLHSVHNAGKDELDFFVLENHD